MVAMKISGVGVLTVEYGVLDRDTIAIVSLHSAVSAVSSDQINKLNSCSKNIKMLKY